MYKKLSIIIPVFNEEKTIAKLLQKVHEVELAGGLEKEIIIINDGSSDNTLLEINDYKALNSKCKLISNDQNRGKGASVQLALPYTTGDLVVIQDGDHEYDPAELNLLLDPFLKNHADVVYGSRFLGGKPTRKLYFFHSLGNGFLTFVSNLFNNLNLTDMECCYKMFRKDMLCSIDLTEKRFGFEPEVTAKISKIKGVRIYEVGVSYYGRTYADGKKIRWKDGFRALYVIFRYGLG